MDELRKSDIFYVITRIGALLLLATIISLLIYFAFRWSPVLSHILTYLVGLGTGTIGVLFYMWYATGLENK